MRRTAPGAHRGRNGAHRPGDRLVDKPPASGRIHSPTGSGRSLILPALLCLAWIATLPTTATPIMDRPGTNPAAANQSTTSPSATNDSTTNSPTANRPTTTPPATADVKPRPGLDRIAWIDSLNSAGLTDSALSVIARSLTEAAAAADTAFLIPLWLRQGRIQNAHGLVRQAEEVLRLASDAAWARGDTATTCKALETLTSAVVSQGRIAEARQIAERHLVLAQESEDRAQEGWARVALARDEWMHGRSDEAIEQCRRAIGVFHEAGERRGEAWTQNGLGIALSGMGRYDEAREAFVAAGRLAAQGGVTMVRIQVANNLGALERMLGDPASAVEHFRESVRLNREIGNMRDAIIPGANLAGCNQDLGRLTEAADSLEAMLEVCHREGYDDLSAIVMNRLASTRADQRRLQEARSLYRRVLDLGDRVPIKNRNDAAIGLAKRLCDVDSTAAALALLEESLTALGDESDVHLRVDIEIEIGRVFLRTGSPERALIPLGHAEETATQMGHASVREDALIGLARAWAALDRPDSSRAVWERAARVWEDLRSQSSDPEWREAAGEWSRWLATELASLILARGEGTEPVRNAYETAMRFKARTLLERMGGVTPGQVAPPESLTVTRLQTETLKDDELLIDFFLGPRQSLVFAISRDSCRVGRLPGEDQLAERIHLYGDLLRTPPPRTAASTPPGDDPVAGLDEAAASLRTLLFRSIEDLIASHRRIYVSADGPLNTVPFGLASGLSAAKADPAREWIRVPSAAVLDLLRTRERRPATGAPRVLALASTRTAGGELRGVVDEVRRLASRYVGTRARILGSRDSLGAADLGDAGDVLHIASHSEANDERPWLSSLELGASRVRAAEIAKARVAPRLAVLSSCQTQYGRVLSGEGVRGLSTALLCAGSDCVVATLWPVEDRTTATFMAAFYDDLSSGRTVAGALKGAQQEIRKNPHTAHPFFWAGFVVVGLGEVEIPLRARAPTWPLTVILAVGVVFALLWVRWRHKMERSAVIRAPRERLMG